MADFIIAYCGPAATPESLWQRWNFDPFLIAALVALAFVISTGRAANTRAGWGAIALMVLVFISPLCALASALFSARAVHHVLLIAAVAPLLALAFPLRRLASPPLAVLAGAHAVILWLWHAPGPYTWGLASISAYWLMQLSLLGSAWVLWRAILLPGSAQSGPPLLGLVATIVQMGLLGALLVFAPQVLYLVHLESTAAWGLSPMADQQLAGLLMWVPAMLPYLVMGLWLIGSGLQPDEEMR